MMMAALQLFHIASLSNCIEKRFRKKMMVRTREMIMENPLTIAIPAMPKKGTITNERAKLVPTEQIFIKRTVGVISKIRSRVPNATPMLLMPPKRLNIARVLSPLAYCAPANNVIVELAVIVNPSASGT